jgi:hypothetical protein
VRDKKNNKNSFEYAPRFLHAKPFIFWRDI